MRFVLRGPAPAEWEARVKVQTANNEYLVMSGQKPTKEGRYYAAPELKLALYALFHGKCAYCEGRLSAAWDVDHFRPAKAVQGLSTHSGYWWLAYKWSNLYPACVACNQFRVDPDNPELGAQGKKDKFPLLDETTRVYLHTQNVANEARALLDPCLDDPQEYLVMTRDGKVLARGNSPMGQATIDELGLWRRPYREMREWALNGLLRANKEDRAFYLSDEAPYCGLIRTYLALNPL